jgi:phosphinothricin acetyltransferase
MIVRPVHVHETTHRNQAGRDGGFGGHHGWFYVKSEFRGQGIGRQLKTALIEEARRLRFHSLIARVAEGSHESLHLNERAGFAHVNTLKEVGRKFGRLLDVHIMQKILE